jgi:beta-glucosidase
MIRSCLLALGVALLVSTPGHADPQIAPDAPTLTVDGKSFRDLDRDGTLEPYEDWRLSPARRADDLVKRMTLAEKAGTMMHGTLPGLGSVAVSGASQEGYDLARVADAIDRRKVTSFITRLSVSPRQLAEANNAVQRIAAASRLGIPVTISTDPRNQLHDDIGLSVNAHGFSQWPDALGFGAIGDPAMVRRFGTIARAEYRAVGIHEALSPQADLATEPRWPRQSGTFGSSARLVSPLVGAYVEGFQGGRTGLARDGVIAVVKHWVGYGAEPEGFDAHNFYGRVARLDNRSFAEHIAAFRGAFAAHAAGIMPTYPIVTGVSIDGKPLEAVGAGFNRQLLGDLLRRKMGFGGIILSDWAVTNTCGPACRDPQKPQGIGDFAMSWGVEDLSEGDRFVKGIDAGLDQFGGVERPDLILDAVKAGKIAEARIDDSVRRVLIAKFEQGLFENPFVDPAATATIFDKPATLAASREAQQRSQVLLKADRRHLPLRAGLRVYAPGLSADAVRAAGYSVAANPAEADVAILRMSAPHELLHPNHFFGSRHHEGRLDFRDGDADYEALKTVSAKVPVIVSVFLDRPAILTNVRDKAVVLLANFGVGDAALLDVVAGKARAGGRLPFELPSSMAAVAAQDPARTDDSAQPLYRAGFGLGAR